ncbi:acetate/propionate family kinase [Marinilabilia sp.]|uniref:acetate/propionate family kinase n=1 Tax=Marinilabilia sp. TaxID=2021252 RepID=UPI0025B8872C|nr:acetate/propionate family kinase [Marinilabilia sp.]
MNSEQVCILTINGGSSSIKFALYEAGGTPTRLLHGEIDRIGLKDSTLIFNNEKGDQKDTLQIEASDNHSAINFLLNWLEEQDRFSSVKAVGHRVVHGMNHTVPELITPELMDELHRIAPYDPDHLPDEIELIETICKRHPKLTQVACFDTAFHCTMPRVAKLIPIPRRFDTKGIQRYGFHGLSYAYLMEELVRVTDEKTANGRIILAHLGNGASLAAIRENKSIDTSMGFTPASGLMMGSRPGDLDPGVVWYMMQSENLTPKEFNNMINHDSGLLGISETSSDMHDLIERQERDVRAAEAVELFCYTIRKWIGAFAAVLGGIDTLIFAGGIGENSLEVRSRICKGLEFLGIALDEKRNLANAPVISRESEKVVVRVMHTDEEWMIAKTVSQMINLTEI